MQKYEGKVKKSHTVNPRISPLGAYSRRDLNIFLVVGHIPVEIFLLVNCFLDAIGYFLKDRQIYG